MRVRKREKRNRKMRLLIDLEGLNELEKSI